MPRRPRPAYRRPPRSVGDEQQQQQQQQQNVPLKSNRPSKVRASGKDHILRKDSARSVQDFEEGSTRRLSQKGKQLQVEQPLKGRALPRQESTSDEESESSEEFEKASAQGSVSASEDGSEEDESESESDADAPRVAIWEEDNQDFLMKVPDEEKDVNPEKILQNDLQGVPLGALRRAQHLLSQAEAETDSGSDSDDEYLQSNSKGKGKERIEWSTKRRTDILSRPNKHAPVELTAKKPVSRHRVVVDAPKIVPRDPRFLPTAGSFDIQKFHQSYGFLADKRQSELQTLKESLAKARKALSSSPRDLRSEREEEVRTLEHAVKRVESLVNKDRLDRVEQDALSKRKKEEVEQRKQGKGQWFLKKAEKKELLLKARYEALAKEGGQRAVKKAIEKKQKKISQREKRSRPYSNDESRRKREGEALSGRPNKRTRT